jgi:hypothetical protein
MSYLYQAAGELGFVMHLPEDFKRRFFVPRSDGLWGPSRHS